MSNAAAPSHFIVERARQYLKEHGGRVREEQLLAHVFGLRGRSDVWRHLLRDALATASDLHRRDDGSWEIPSPIPVGLGDYTVLDIETTGLNPQRQRIIEIALHRYRDGHRVERWSTPVNPERRLPTYIRHLTGLNNLTLAEAPRFAEVADELLARLGDDYLIGQNVGFDLSFLNAELARLGRPPLRNLTIDLPPLAVALLPSMRRPHLEAIAQALGVMATQRHRADADAALTATCFERLVARAASIGPVSWADLVALTSQPSAPTAQRPLPTAAGSNPPSASPAALPESAPTTIRRGRNVLDRRWLDDLPNRPGVYLMRDAAGQVIYVGKAKNLRQRVRSYYSQPLGLTRKMDGLLEAIQQIDIEVVGSELEALLRESRLIKQLLPRYNVQQRYYEQYPFIKIDLASPYPRITATRSVADDGSRYFGPFRHASAVQTTIELLTDLFPVRTCTQKVRRPDQRWRPCLRLDFGQCLGPCVGQTDQATYGRLIEDIIAYLDGRREPLVNRLWEQLRAASDRLDFERAARLRDAIGQVNQVTIAHQLLTAAVERTHRLIILPSASGGAREVLLIVGGRLVCQQRLADAASVAAGATQLHAAWQTASVALASGGPIDQAVIDEIAIINRWLSQHEDTPACQPLPANPDQLASWQAAIAALPALAALSAPPTVRRRTAVMPELADRFYRDE